jgi:hypothetical protein
VTTPMFWLDSRPMEQTSAHETNASSGHDLIDLALRPHLRRHLSDAVTERPERHPHTIPNGDAVFLRGIAGPGRRRGLPVRVGALQKGMLIFPGRRLVGRNCLVPA